MTDYSNLVLGLGAGGSLAGLIWSAASDLRAFRIPNAACLLILAGFLAATPALGLPALASGLITGAVTLLVGLALWRSGWVGGGDVKLAAAAAAWAGPGLIEAFVLATALSGAALGLLLLSPARRWLPTPADGEIRESLAQPMPYGVALALGGAIVLTIRVGGAA